MLYVLITGKRRICGKTSQHWKFSSEKKCVDFRKWLEEVHGEVFEIGAGEFKESGTSIGTVAVVIKKQYKTNQ